MDIDSEDIQVYVKYFDITLIPSMVFFFNAHHMKMDSGYNVLSANIISLIFLLHCIFAGETFWNHGSLVSTRFRLCSLCMFP